MHVASLLITAGEDDYHEGYPDAAETARETAGNDVLDYLSRRRLRGSSRLRQS